MTTLYLYDTTHPSTSQKANLVLLFMAIQHGLPRFHETTQTTKKFTITTWTLAKIHPNTKPNEFMESTQKILIRQTFCSVHLRFHFAGKPPAKAQLPTTQNCTSIRHGHPHIGQYPQLLWRNAYHAFLQLLTNSSKHAKAKQIFCLTNTEHYKRYNNNKRSLSSHVIRTSDP